MCASETYFVGFSKVLDKNYVHYTNPVAYYNEYKCPSENKQYSYSEVLSADSKYSFRIHGFTDLKENCADSSMKFQAKFYSVYNDEEKVYLFSWCCKKDIFKDYRLDPRKECCGLSGSMSPYASTSKGQVSTISGNKKSKISNGRILRDNPPCCRTQARKALCEPFTLLQTGNGQGKNSRDCPPLSGLANVTKNLKEDIPYFAPAYYAISKGAGKIRELSTMSTCVLKDYKYFYTFRNIVDGLKNGFDEKYGLCCKRQNMFAESATTMVNECCVTYTTEMNAAVSKNKLSCSPKKGGAKGQVLYYRPCIPGACSRDKNNSLSAADKFRVKYHSMIVEREQSTKSPLYGSEIYFKSKNTYALGDSQSIFIANT